MKIGIPKALLYYKYHVLWETFFKKLGYEVVISGDTNKQILEDGLNYSAYESCLASKIYIGHVFNLIGKCDYIFIPRFCSFKDKDVTCVKFNALYDICKNLFSGIKIITYNMDYLKGENEILGFINIGKQLGQGYLKSIEAYKIAKKEYYKEYENKVKDQVKLFKENKSKKDKLNILVVSHPYISHDECLGKQILNPLKKMNVNLIYADLVEKKYLQNGWKQFSKSIYWKDNKLLLSGISNYLDKVDGIAFITVFSCGPDSLVTELCLRKIKNIPCLNIVLDEINSSTGMQTRLESYVDILTEKKRVLLYG